MTPILISRQLSDDCGCPEEEWAIDGVHVTLHGEEDASGHILLAGEDWEMDVFMETDDLHKLLDRAIEEVSKLPRET